MDHNRSNNQLSREEVMKKIFVFIFVALLIPVLADAQALTWYRTTTGTVAWDASPKVATTDQANQYQVMYRTDMVSAGATVGQPIVALQLAVVIPVDVATYFFGVKARRMQNGVMVAESAISWSTDPAVTNNAPWGFNTIIAPTWPVGLRVLPQP